MNTESNQPTNKPTKSKWWKIIFYTSIALGILSATVVVGLLYFPHLYLNAFIKNKIITEFAKEYPEYTLAIADVNIYLLADNIEFTSIVFAAKDSSFSCSLDKPSIQRYWMDTIYIRRCKCPWSPR
ncbi:MAG: hypothetical protein IPM69_12625 [Ignavibacteria bacterium]|nr:hypothetical protein [Ignavibacteria bacterium]